MTPADEDRVPRVGHLAGLRELLVDRLTSGLLRRPPAAVVLGLMYVGDQLAATREAAA